MLVVTHLVLHYWLVLELLKAEVLLVGSSHVGALHELLTLISSCIFLFCWYFASLRVLLEILLLPELLLVFALAEFASLGVAFKPI